MQGMQKYGMQKYVNMEKNFGQFGVSQILCHPFNHIQNYFRPVPCIYLLTFLQLAQLG